MRRQENQPARPTAGCLPVPLFNQRKRNRVPLTSAPSENEFFSHSEYMTSSTTPGAYGCNQASGQSSLASQSQLWSRQGFQGPTLPQQYGGNRPAPGPSPAMSHYAPTPHPYRAEGAGSKMGQFSKPPRKQEPIPSGNSGQREGPAPRVPDNKYGKPTSHTTVSHMGQQSIYKPQNPTHQYSQQSKPVPAPVPPTSRPSACVPQPQSKSWNFTSSFGPQKSSFEGSKSKNPLQKVQQAPSQQETSPAKPAFENSLRIITAVIDGMRHWSQFRDKVPYLFEIFATLDSAVTLGCHGAKNFLMRSGKEVVQCVFYENEQELPRLIRGQVHRCVGNYDRSRDVLTCVSVRPGLPSELRNAQEAVKACDAEMRSLVKSFSEV